MILIDRMLIGGIAFVLDKIARAADAEREDVASLHERLLLAQMQLETGEIDEQAYRALEVDLLARLQQARARENEENEENEEEVAPTAPRPASARRRRRKRTRGG